MCCAAHHPRSFGFQTAAERIFMRVLIGVVLALGIAGHATAAGLSTWSGTIGLVHERGLNHPSTKLALGASSSRTDFTGLTGAAHDALNAKTTCWIAWRFKEKSGAWRYYRQAGRPHVTAAGYVQDSPCIGSTGMTMRVQLLSSHQLRVQFDTEPISDTADFAAAYAGRLRR
jgi:hypothetical protein